MQRHNNTNNAPILAFTLFIGVPLKRYKYCGKEQDEEPSKASSRTPLKKQIKGEQTGLYYYGARYYAPWLCRFTSVDPKALEYIHQSSYVFADNNPIVKYDVNGEGVLAEGSDPEVQQQPSHTINDTKTSSFDNLDKFLCCLDEDTVYIDNNELVEVEPRVENVFKAPELDSSKIDNSVQITKEDAKIAFEKDRSDTTYGFVKLGDEYAKVFFDSEFDDDGKRGSYFAQTPKKIPFSMSLDLVNNNPISVNFDSRGFITNATFNRVLLAVNNLQTSINTTTIPIRDPKQGFSISVHYSTFGNVENERNNAIQISNFLNRTFNTPVASATFKTPGVTTPTGVVGFFLQSSEISLTITTKINIYDF